MKDGPGFFHEQVAFTLHKSKQNRSEQPLAVIHEAVSNSPLKLSVLYYGFSVLYYGISVWYYGISVWYHGISVWYHGISGLYYGISGLYYGVSGLYYRKEISTSQILR